MFGVTGCSSVSPYFSQNVYTDAMYGYVLNDSLQFVHKTFGDVEFETDRRKIIRSVPKTIRPVDNILAYGTTGQSPIYRYYILLDSKKEWKDRPSNVYVKDSVTDGHSITFLFVDRDSVPDSDMGFIVQNVGYGKDFRESFVSLEESLNDCFRFSNNYLACLDKIDAYPEGSERDRFFKLQMQLTFSSFMGNNTRYKELIKEYEHFAVDSSKRKKISESNNAGGSWQEEIMAVAEDEKLVMFNENHFYPNHRTAITELLPGLYDIGFRYLALEALEYDENDDINHRDGLKIDDGFYTREPRFIELIRKAKSLGMTLVSYDNPEADGNRERIQAENIYNKTFLDDPEGRTIVLAGISHIFETEDRKGKEWMASYFKEKYGIDPVTISQTAFNNYHEDVEGAVLFDSDSLGPEYSSMVDYVLINNLKPFSGRTLPYMNPHNFAVQLSVFPQEKIQSGTSFMNLLPYYNDYLEKGESTSINLANGDYVYYVLNAEGEVLKSERVQID